MEKRSILNIDNVVKVIIFFFVGFAFFLLMWPYGMENEGVFEITDPSRTYTFYDSSYSSHAEYVEAFITGDLDGTAKVDIHYYPDTIHQVWSFDFQAGRSDSSGRWDFYARKIRVKYVPGTAKKGRLKIVTKVL
jgi:hypothetical protein